MTWKNLFVIEVKNFIEEINFVSNQITITEFINIRTKYFDKFPKRFRSLAIRLIGSNKYCKFVINENLLYKILNNKF